MQLTVLIGNDIADQHADLVAEWGLFRYIEYRKTKILFDTGAKGALVRNAERLGVDLSLSARANHWRECAPCQGGAFQCVPAHHPGSPPAGSNQSSCGGREMAEAFG